MNEMKKLGQDLKKEAEKTVEEVKQGTADALESAKPIVEKAKDGVVKAKRGVRKSAKNAEKKAAAAAEKAKTGVRRVADKVASGEGAPVVYVQYQGIEEKVEDLVAAAKAAFAAEHARTKVADLKLYIKPEEHAAYYVVNEKFAGRVDF